MAAQHLAAIEIQRMARGFLARQRLRGAARPRPGRRAPLVSRFVAQAGVDSSAADPLRGFEDWVASRIQAWWRMLPFRRYYRWQRFPVFHIAAMQLQFAVRRYLTRKHSRADEAALPPSRTAAARRIQVRCSATAPPPLPRPHAPWPRGSVPGSATATGAFTATTAT